VSLAKFGQSALLLLIALAVVPSGGAQTYTVLYSFTGGADGAFPTAGLIQDSAGNLYGTTSNGSPPQTGSVFKLSPSGRFKVLHSFGIGGTGGARPYAGLVQDSAGNLYGTTIGGGGSGQGTVFKMDKRGKFRVLYSFSGNADGGQPYSPLILDAVGNLYGTTYGGGDTQTCSGGCGIVFKLDVNGSETVLRTFSSFEGGQHPTGGLILDSAGNLYGTTEFGGDAVCGDPNFKGCGVVFKLDANGNETVFHTFEYVAGDSPHAGLIGDTAGNFYGTTTFGGIGRSTVRGTAPCGGLGCGVVFKLDDKGTENVLHLFTGRADGAAPFFGTLIMDSAGNFYGTTLLGGPPSCAYFDCGVVFKLDQSSNETVLHTFSIRNGNGTYGYGPAGGVIMDSAGNLYGTTYFGGNLNDCQGQGCGVVFKITP
jgi:uncharacterized repeat protein (TIGR03803 family)